MYPFDNQNQIAINRSSYFLFFYYYCISFCEFLLFGCSNKKLKNFILFFQDNKWLLINLKCHAKKK